MFIPHKKSNQEKPTGRWHEALRAVEPSPKPAVQKAPPAPATFLQRLAAYTLDWSICFVLSQPIRFLINFADLGMVITAVLLPAILFSVWALYNIAFEAKFSATPGKYLLGLTIRTDAGHPLSAQAALGRFTAAGLSWLTLNIGHKMALFRKDRKTLHDMVSATVVIADPQPMASLPATSGATALRWQIAGSALFVLITLISFYRIFMAVTEAMRGMMIAG